MKIYSSRGNVHSRFTDIGPFSSRFSRSGIMEDINMQRYLLLMNDVCRKEE